MPDLLDELGALEHRWRDAIVDYAVECEVDAIGRCIDQLSALIARHEARGKVVAELGPYEFLAPEFADDPLGGLDICTHGDETEGSTFEVELRRVYPQMKADKRYRIDIVELPEDTNV